MSATIGLLDKFVVIGKAGRDCSIFVYGSDSENEMIMITAMDGFFEAMKILLKCVRCFSVIFRDKLERNEMLKKMPSLFLLMDEFCDAG